MASGFFIQAGLGIIIGALAPQLAGIFPLFVILYGFFLFFGEMGPGDCTILISAEMYQPLSVAPCTVSRPLWAKPVQP